MRKWNSDFELNIFILGPMGKEGSLDSSCAQIQAALLSILNEPATQTLLNKFGTQRTQVRIPDQLLGADIINDVLHNIDIADLVVVNITPNDGPSGEFSPNVFYELGILHSLGIPYIVVRESGTALPFYFRATRAISLERFSREELRTSLRPSILEFLRSDAPSAFKDNRVSDFYGKIPIVDVSAVTGLATGYYLNFVERAIREGGFITHYPDRIRHLIICRPNDIFNTFEEDRENLVQTLQKQLGLSLTRDTLPSKRDSDRRSLGADFLCDPETGEMYDIIVDLPTTSYTLVKSPRFRSLMVRLGGAKNQNSLYLRQNSQHLLDAFDSAIEYHMSFDDRIRASAVSFCAIEELPSRIKKVGLTK